jgi:hypothetical protein
MMEDVIVGLLVAVIFIAIKKIGKGGTNNA